MFDSEAENSDNGFIYLLFILLYYTYILYFLHCGLLSIVTIQVILFPVFITY